MKPLLLLCLALAATPLPAALQAELTDHIAYVRPDGADDDRAALAAAWHAATPAIIDLRYLHDAPGSDLRALLHTPGTAPRILLINAATPADLLGLLRKGLPGVITVGPADIAADITVTTDVGVDRSAFAAAAQGTAMADLLGSAPQKQRYDEAAMVRDYAATGHHESAPAEAPAAGETEPASAPPPAGPIDGVLQRAWHLAQGLRALAH